ncbi:MAG: sugar porter family MFS transporter [Mangrovibacterium sp.]
MSLNNLNQTNNTHYLMLSCLVASLGGLLFGFDTAVISGNVGMIEEFFDLTKLQKGWFTSSALIGCIIGAAIAGNLGDRFGRKPVLIVSAFLFFISAFFSMIPSSFTLLVPARIIGGVGVGIASVLSPMYISEFSPAKIRGRLVALYQLSIVVGILLAYFSNSMLQSNALNGIAQSSGEGWWHKIFYSEVWRAMFGMEMIPALLFFLLLLIVPESPRWLIQKGAVDKGLDILCKIGGEKDSSSEYNKIKELLNENKGSLKDLLKPGLITALIVGVGLSVFGQLTGINVIIYYGPDILKDAGFELDSALQFQVILGFINLFFTIVAIFFIDKVGRRPLLLGGMGFLVITLLAAGLLFTTVNSNSLALVVVLGLYVACFAFSIGAVIWVLTPEIYPNYVRGRAMSIAVFANWTTNAMAAYLFPWYVDRFGMHTGFFTFAAICFAATIFFWKYIPETKGKSLEEIEQMWTNRSKK